MQGRGGMREVFRVRCGLFSAAFVELLMAIPVHAGQPQPFTYEFLTTPVEGPQNPAIDERYTAQWSACQKRAVSTQANEACFAAEFARHDKVLNRTWRTALARIAPQLRGQLVTAQRKWIVERDPFCNSEADRFRGGTIVPVVYLHCRVEETIRRTLWLEQLR
jgi:uncharacterized protein YecT (DUF1311 family)